MSSELESFQVVFIDADADKPYRLYFFEVQIAGQQRLGKEIVLRSHLSAIIETASGELILSSPDHLHDLAPAETLPEITLLRSCT